MASRRDAALRRRIQIVHDIPGRLRMRLPPRTDPDGVLERLQRVAGVRSTAWAPTTRGLVVAYEPPATSAAIVDVAREVLGIAVDVAAPPAPRDAASPAFGAAVSGSFGELDQRVRRVTRNAIGLGALVPTALAVWAIREIALGRAAPLAWSTALWYAHGLFRDYSAPSS